MRYYSGVEHYQDGKDPSRPIEIIHYDDRTPAAIRVVSSSHRGGATAVITQRTSEVIVPYADVVKAIQACEKADASRAITAILRIVHDQLRLRKLYAENLNTLKMMLILAASICILNFLLFKTPEYYLIALVPILLGVPGLIWGLRKVNVLALHHQEEVAICRAALPAIRQLAAQDQMPMKLYKEDVKTLRLLSRKDRKFAKTANEIIRHAGR